MVYQNSYLAQKHVFSLISCFECESGNEVSGDLVVYPSIEEGNIPDSLDEWQYSEPVTRSRAKMQTGGKSLLQADAVTDEQDIWPVWDWKLVSYPMYVAHSLVDALVTTKRWLLK